VDDLSSAHVYLRLPPGQSFEDIPSDTLEDCCQLVKANSIQGNKLDNVGIVWTPVSNLKKTASMEVGQVTPLCNAGYCNAHVHKLSVELSSVDPGSVSHQP
jgi:hypothetical protein